MTDLQQLSATLASWTGDHDQLAVRDQMLAFAATHDDALWRTCPEAHFTGSALVVNEAGDQSLLIWHEKLKLWLQPGGHADGDGDLARVALRECTEETEIEGLRWDRFFDLDIHQVNPPREHAHLHMDVRSLVVAPSGAEPRANAEVQQFRWIGLTDLAHDDSYDSSLRRMATRALKS